METTAKVLALLADGASQAEIARLLSAPRNRAHLKRRLISAGLLPAHCQACGISQWRGRPLALELHHVNGDGKDNRLANLELLCPNCHSQTDSWGGRNSRRPDLRLITGPRPPGSEPALARRTNLRLIPASDDEGNAAY